MSGAYGPADDAESIATIRRALDPAAPSRLLGKWLISSQLDSKLQPLRVGVVEDPSGKTVGRVTVQEGDGLDDASEAVLQARRYVCDSEGSRAAEVEAEPRGVVPSERAEIQVRSDRATGAGELVKFGQPVWYRFSFKIAGDWPQHTWTSPTRLAITTGWPAGFAANPEISGEDGLSKNRPECEPGHVRLGSHS